MVYGQQLEHAGWIGPSSLVSRASSRQFDCTSFTSVQIKMRTNYGFIMSSSHHTLLLQLWNRKEKIRVLPLLSFLLSLSLFRKLSRISWSNSDENALYYWWKHILTASPTAPKPKTATVEPGCTLAVFHTAPRPWISTQKICELVSQKRKKEEQV